MSGASEVPPQRLGDRALAHLRSVVDLPDVGGTRYEIVEPIGRGGMGSVFRARDCELDRDVALKVVALPEQGSGLAQRLVAEAKVLARLEHPGIVPVHDVGRLQDGRVYCAMKFVQGESLDRRLPQLTQAERVRVFLRIGEAVAFAHAQGVVHRDLKPANVMLGAFGEVLVLDWGLAEPATAGRPSLRAGTPGFMAPEQERGEPVDARSDVFALGRLLAALALPGRTFAAIVAKATAPAADARYRAVADLADDVARAFAGESVSALREGPWLWLVRQYKRYRAAVWLVLGYAVLRIGFELARVWLRDP